MFHQRQPSGEYVATCEAVPGWFCFGETLPETRDRAEWSLRDHILGHVRLAHFEVPVINHQLRAA